MMNINNNLSTENTLIELKNISFSYEDKVILNNINLSLNAHEQIGIVGATGCGKSTLLQLTMGLLKTNKGQIILFKKERETEKDFSKIRINVGYLFQNADDQLFSPTAIEDIAFGPLNQGKSEKEAKSISQNLLSKLNIEYLKDRVTHKLSGGEKKLVALASILAMKPKFLLLDEPVTGLDPKTKKKITKLLTELQLPMIIISHDWVFLKQVTDKILQLKNGTLTTNIRID